MRTIVKAARMRAGRLILAAGLVLSAAAHPSPATDKVLQNVRVPAGFAFEVYADNVPGARSMALGKHGTLFVGTRTDKIYAVDGASAGRAKAEARVFASGLNMPNGVAYRDGALYVAEISRVLRYDGVDGSGAAPQPKVVRDDFPKDRHHGWKYLAFGPDGKLYVPIGAPCNVCNEPSYANITRMNADGSGLEVFARGVRNSVGFTWHPTTRELWFTDNGRDWLGEDQPPCELNHAPRAGLNFGFPFCHGKNTVDPEFGKLGECGKATAPAQLLGAHVAPLAVKFYTGTAFPESYRNRLFIAEHGSWNRKQLNGYRITMAKLDGAEAKEYQVFASGFHRDKEIFGRPVDLLMLDDGSMLVSDDFAGAIYRIRYVVRP
jgi:glucose/arabinose dehydrogenase